MKLKVKKLLFLAFCSLAVIGYLSVTHISVLAQYPGLGW
ncbi:hypothetical protein CLAUR_041020 [Clostridium felsineum]|nr:hypothetical protein CLAUR_028430 [Clostridium felsineum]URZ04036.1 hypothetical protein CLAUR_041020 [Clostridium felsineum]